jgi:8-oxo-dGTP pyrophosphatase MutT (NUDIX family)
MVAGSILPVSFNDKNELCFLFGKENPMEDSAKGFSDFGGRMDKGETPYSAALRECSEELTGFLGDKKQLGKKIKKNGGYLPLTFDTYHVHIVYLAYDENLVDYYNNNHSFLWDKMDKNVLNDSKLFEKIEINWFTIKQIQKRRSEFRNFYRAFTDEFLKEEDNIKKFINKCSKKRRGKSKTQRNR